MLAVNYSTIRNSFKDYCDRATNGEEVIVTRKEEKNVVIISLEKYNQMIKEINKYIICIWMINNIIFFEQYC